MTRGFEVRALGEIALRCRDLEVMTAFYRDVVGLAPMPGNHAPHIRFFRIAEGHGGHTAVLALFRDGTPRPGASSSLHHLALTLDFAAQEAAMRWLEARGVGFRVETFGWVGWRGVFFADPEGNMVEFVAHDASLHEAPDHAVE